MFLFVKIYHVELVVAIISYALPCLRFSNLHATIANKHIRACAILLHEFVKTHWPFQRNPYFVIKPIYYRIPLTPRSKIRTGIYLNAFCHIIFCRMAKPSLNRQWKGYFPSLRGQL